MAEGPVIPQSEAGKTQNRGILNQLFRGFVSMKTGIGLLFLLMAAAFLGTLIPPGRENVLLGDVYHTWWFRLLLGLLCVNVLTCSARRLPVLWKATVSPQVSPIPKLDSLPNYRQLTTQLPIEGAAVTVANLLARDGFRIRTDQDEAGPIIYAERGRLAPWGTLTVHLSLLVITAGALYGNIYGFSQDIALPVGKAIEISSSQYPGVKQPFSLKLNNFTTEYYKDGSVSDWISDITVEQNGSKVLSREVKVNHPLEYNGIMVYQFSYGTSLNTQITNSKGEVVKEASVAEHGVLENDGIVVRPMRFIPDFNPDQPMVSMSPELRNPHVLYIIYRNGREVDWGAAKLGEVIPLGHNTVKFTAAQPFSGLQIKHDPGVPVVWFGFIMMAAGFFVSLYTRRLRLWLTVTNKAGTAKVDIGGQGNRELFGQVTDNLNKHLAPAGASRRKT